MLSYRHAFHAGNHADVLKHTVLVVLLRHLNQKETAYTYVDTHAGAGLYSLTEGYATKNAEFRDGIAQLWTRTDLPEPLADYRNLIRSFNPGDALRFYPGSPLIAQRLMRASDKLRLFELHSSDYELLAENCKPMKRQAQVQKMDGFVGLKAVLPPPSRRGLVLIDPSYETRDDYRNVVSALNEGLKRFATGVFAVWYPCLQRPDVDTMRRKLHALSVKWLDVTLNVQHPSPDGFGMHGSGMFIVNPPWQLGATLQTCLPLLTKILAHDDGAYFTLEK